MGSNPSLSINIGLESHLCLEEDRKLFCDCRTGQACSICTGHPGGRSRPPGAQVLARVVRLAHYLGARVNRPLRFYKKIYPYHDLWAGYQRSQAPWYPLAQGGRLVDLRGETYHLQKLLLQEDPAATNHHDIDHGRSGSALVQVVSGMKTYDSPASAVSGVMNYLRTLRRVALDLELISPASVVKTDVNISLGSSWRLQVKNLSSDRSIRSAVRQGVDLIPHLTGHSTYHYRGGRLIYSRPKRPYPYVRQGDLGDIDLPRVQASRTYPDLYRQVAACPGAGSPDQISGLVNRLWAQRHQTKYRRVWELLARGSEYQAIHHQANLSQVTPLHRAWIQEAVHTDQDLVANFRRIQPWLKLRGIYYKSSYVKSCIWARLRSNN